MQTSVFWHEALPQRSIVTQPTPLKQSYDVVVVGGGYTGLSAAQTLAQAGVDVAVLETNTIGWGASSRNGGMALPGFQQGLQKVFKTYGEQLGRELWNGSLAALRHTADLIRDEQIECNFTPTGYALLASKPSHMAWMQEEAEWFDKTLDHTLTLRSPDDITDVVGTDVFYGALVDELGAGIQPTKYMMGLAEVAQQHGANLFENSRASAVEPIHGGFNVKVGLESIRCDHVIFATNGYSKSEQVKHRIIPVGSYIIVTEPLPSDLAERLIPKRRQLFDSKNFLNYFRLTPDNRILWGGRNNLSTGLDLQESKQHLHASLLQTFPELTDFAITHSWSGNLGVCVDKMPHIGQVDGAYFALGYGGHGVAMSTHLGAEVAQLVLGKKQTSPFMEIPAPMPFLHQAGTVFLPAASAYFRFLDFVS